MFNNKKRTNSDIYTLAKSKGLYLYEIAREINMHDSNFSRLLRYELSEKHKNAILAAIEKLARGRVKNG